MVSYARVRSTYTATDKACRYARVCALAGPYGGGGCAATNHSHHTGELDSVYMQTQLQAHLYSELRGRNVFINQPDNYWFQGGQKSGSWGAARAHAGTLPLSLTCECVCVVASGMGYDEYQYSLPRWQDVSVSRAVKQQRRRMSLCLF